MKKVLLFITACISATILSGQFIYKIKADSVLITNDSCNAELIIENSTKHVLGFLYNKGNGRTEFRTGSAIGDFILNQNNTNQSARMWVTGQIRTDSMIRIGQLTSDPSGANGMIYYNSTNNRFRGYRAGGWEDFLTSGNIEGSNGLLYNTSTNKIELGGLGYYDGRLTRDTYINTYDGTTDRKLIINTGTAPNSGGLFLQIDRTNGAMFRGEGNGFNAQTATVVRVGNFDANGNDATESNNTNLLTTQEIFNNGWGTNGSFKGLLVRLNGSNQDNNYGLTGIEINTRHHYTSTSNVNGTAKNTALKLTANSVGAQGWLQALTYALYVDSGRVYSRDSVMFGTTTPGAFFHVNGTSRFDLGSDATGDIFYRNSSGLMTRLPIGSSGQVLTVQSGLPAWTTDKIKATETLDFPNTSSLASSTLSITVTGASVGDHVLISKTDGTSSNGELYTGTVSATNTVTIRFQNVSGSSVDLSSASYNITIIKF